MTEWGIMRRNVGPARTGFVGAGPRACPYRSRAWAGGRSGTGQRGRRPFGIVPTGARQSGFASRATTGGCPYELRMIDLAGRGFRVPPCGAQKRGMSNKPNLRLFWAENEGRRENEPNSPGPWRAREIRNTKLEIRNKFETRMIEADQSAPNESNWAERTAGGHGPSCGMVGETPRSRECQTNPISRLLGQE